MTTPSTGPEQGGRAPVVFLAYHYPPSAEVGAIRLAKVAAALRAAGHDVTVIRAGTPGDADGPSGEVLSVVPAPSLRDLYLELKAGLAAAPWAGGNGGPAEPVADTWTPPTRVGGLKRLLYSLFWLPDDQQGFIWRAARAAAAAVHRGGPGTVLYSSSPPASAQVAALLAQSWTGCPWVVELRDPWTDNPGKPWYCRTAATDAVERWLERTCLRRAAAVVAVSEGIERLARAKFDPVGAKLVLVRNGIDRIEAPPPRRARPVRVLHSGTCYLGRDPRPLLGAVAAIARARSLGPADLQVEFLGKCAYFDGISLRAAAADLGLADIVRFVPWVPHEEARARMLDASILLLLAEGQPDQVPNKLYEYLGSRRPILVFADPGGETDRMVRAVGGHTVVTAASADLTAAVDSALFGEPDLAAQNLAVLQGWTSAAQMSELVRTVDRVARAAQPGRLPSASR